GLSEVRIEGRPVRGAVEIRQAFRTLADHLPQLAALVERELEALEHLRAVDGMEHSAEAHLLCAAPAPQVAVHGDEMGQVALLGMRDFLDPQVHKKVGERLQRGWHAYISRGSR